MNTFTVYDDNGDEFICGLEKAAAIQTAWEASHADNELFTVRWDDNDSVGPIIWETPRRWVWVQYDKQGEYEPHMAFLDTEEDRKASDFEIQELEDQGHNAIYGQTFPNPK